MVRADVAVADARASERKLLGLRPEIWREALLAWGAQRAIILGLLVGWGVLLGRCSARQSPMCVFDPLFGYDAKWYAAIAQGGYSALPRAAFAPLAPLLERALMPVALGSPMLAGLAVAWAAELVGLALLRELLALDAGPDIARRTLYVLALFPTSVFLVMPYSESLFLALSVGAFLAVRRRRWLLAGTLAALASLTRQVGLLLLVPLVIATLPVAAAQFSGPRMLGVRLRALWPISAALALPVLATGAWQWYLDRRLGVAGAVGRAAASAAWRRYPSWPWDGLARDIAAVAHGESAGAAIGVARDLLFAALWIALAVALTVGWRRWPLDYVLYAWASLAMVLVLPMHADAVDALNSLARYMLVVFPCVVALAAWSARSRRRSGALFAASVALLAGAVAVMAAGGFVA